MKSKIVFLEDEELFRFINAYVFQQTGVEFEMQKASNGIEALNFVNSLLNKNLSIPDYIFLKLNMPVMDGFQFIQVIQKVESGNRKKITIIILMAKMNETDIDKIKELGIDHFISNSSSAFDLKQILDLS